MATPEPTLGDVLHAITLVADMQRVLQEEVSSLRRAMSDEFSALRRRVDALDRDVDGLARRLMAGGE